MYYVQIVGNFCVASLSVYVYVVTANDSLDKN